MKYLSRGLMFSLCAVCTFSVIAGDRSDVEFLSDPHSPTRDLPFSEAVRVGNILFLSGQIGLAPGSMNLVPGGIKAETRQTLSNIKDTLEKYGSSLSRVVKCTVFLADIEEWSAMNEIYVEFFSQYPPARSALGTSGLALGARTEIECIATVDS